MSGFSPLRPRFSSCEIYSRKSGTWLVYLSVIWVSLPILTPRDTSSLAGGWYMAASAPREVVSPLSESKANDSG
jgi:hypothetical protein